MKYNPKVHESFVRDPRFSELHPYQDPSTTQGILQVLYETEQYLKAISGMDRFSLNPAGGSQGIFSNVAIIRAYHEARGEGAQRDEIITTILSHPGNAGTAAALFKGRMTKLIILTSLFRITQHRISLGSLFKFFLCFLISRIHIRVILFGQLTICFFDSRVIGPAVDSQNLVVISFLCHCIPLPRYTTSGAIAMAVRKPLLREPLLLLSITFH